MHKIAIKIEKKTPTVLEKTVSLPQLVNFDCPEFTHIAHLSDIHLYPLKRHDEYLSCFNKLYQKLTEIKYKLLIVITGDLFDDKHNFKPETFKIMREFLKNLSSIAHTCIIAGNHDMLEQNLSRLDALSAIVDDIPNLTYFCKSGIYVPSHNNIAFVVSSLYDKTFITYDQANTIAPTYTKIALYHGAIVGAVTDAGHKIEDSQNETSSRYRTISDFSGFDAVLLGDIHKHQIFGNGKMCYASSLIQQNHGESIDGHGFVLWSGMHVMHEFKPSFIPINNDWVHFTIYIKNGIILPVDMPAGKNMYLRVIQDNTNISTVTELINNFVTSNGIKLCKLEQQTIANSINSNEIPVEVINHQDDEEIIKHELTNKDQVFVDKILNLHKEYCIERTKTTSTAIWVPLWMEFKNMFGFYGNKVHKFNFDNGIIGIIGNNYAGKTSISNTLLFGLFGKTPLNPTGRSYNIDTINNRENNGYVTVLISHGANFYLIERKSQKQQSTKKTTSDLVSMLASYTFSLEIHQCDCNGNKLHNIAEKRTNGTDTALKELIGDIDTFMETNLISKDSTSILNKSDTDRLTTLKNVFGLSVFDYYKELNAKKLKLIDSQINEYISKISALKNICSKASKYDLIAITNEREQLNQLICNLQHNTSILENNLNELLLQTHINTQQYSVESLISEQRELDHKHDHKIETTVYENIIATDDKKIKHLLSLLSISDTKTDTYLLMQDMKKLLNGKNPLNKNELMEISGRSGLLSNTIQQLKSQIKQIKTDLDFEPELDLDLDLEPEHNPGINIPLELVTIKSCREKIKLLNPIDESDLIPRNTLPKNITIDQQDHFKLQLSITEYTAKLQQLLKERELLGLVLIEKPTNPEFSSLEKVNQLISHNLKLSKNLILKPTSLSLNSALEQLKLIQDSLVKLGNFKNVMEYPLLLSKKQQLLQNIAELEKLALEKRKIPKQDQHNRLHIITYIPDRQEISDNLEIETEEQTLSVKIKKLKKTIDDSEITILIDKLRKIKSGTISTSLLTQIITCLEAVLHKREIYDEIEGLTINLHLIQEKMRQCGDAIKNNAIVDELLIKQQQTIQTLQTYNQSELATVNQQIEIHELINKQNFLETDIACHKNNQEIHRIDKLNAELLKYKNYFILTDLTKEIDYINSIITKYKQQRAYVIYQYNDKNKLTITKTNNQINQSTRAVEEQHKYNKYHYHKLSAELKKISDEYDILQQDLILSETHDNLQLLQELNELKTKTSYNITILTQQKAYNRYMEITHILEQYNIQQQVNTLKSKLSENKTLLDSYQTKISTLDIFISKCITEKTQIDNIATEILQLTTKLKDLEQEQQLLTTYKSLVDSKGIPFKLLKHKLNALKTDINSIITRFTNYKLIILHDENKQTISFVTQNNETLKCLSTSRMSGYEKVMLEIAVKRALNKYSFNSKCSIMIIDEGFDPMDSTKFGTNSISSELENIVSAITESYSTCILISQRDTRHIVNHIVTVQNIDGIPTFKQRPFKY